MAFLLKFILFIFLVGVMVLLYFGFRIYLTFRQVRNQFRNQQQDDTHGSPRGTTTTTPDGEQITDTRSSERSQRKIIADDEGEYVDFVEEE